ncbi:MAG: SDR family NAD(P)-dependent oxidoreductase [Oscillospiraceae bacterium]|nr:SDR family NAD(P)-dependent oxidoreductase [Oscillospiraceae bacterium]
MAKTVVITGGSSGIGRAAARALMNSGNRVYELSRTGADSDSVTHITADVTDEASLRSAADEIVRREGRIDALICCAGFGISGAVEFTETEAAQRLMDVNFFGVVRTVIAFMPHLRESRGRVVLISSIAGILPIPFQTYYSASKAAINAYAAALQNEVRPFGVSVCAVMPGDIRTGFTAAREKSQKGDELYNGRISRSVARMEKDETEGMSPDAAGAYIARIALKKRVKPYYSVGFVYKLFSVIYRVLPWRFISFILYKMYGGE